MPVGGEGNPTINRSPQFASSTVYDWWKWSCHNYCGHWTLLTFFLPSINNPCLIYLLALPLRSILELEYKGATLSIPLLLFALACLWPCCFIPSQFKWRIIIPDGQENFKLLLLMTGFLKAALRVLPLLSQLFMALSVKLSLLILILRLKYMELLMNQWWLDNYGSHQSNHPLFSGHEKYFEVCSACQGKYSLNMSHHSSNSWHAQPLICLGCYTSTASSFCPPSSADCRSSLRGFSNWPPKIHQRFFYEVCARSQTAFHKLLQFPFAQAYSSICSYSAGAHVPR